MHDDLLEQARHLARLDPKRPRQANLRRAVSAAYYSLFHFLVDEACRMVLGRQHQQAPYRHVLGRAFNHGTIRRACTSFAGGALRATVAKGLPPRFTVPAECRSLAATFVDLQERRHLADYDLTERFTRPDVLGVIQEAENVVRSFNSLKASNEKRFFLACLWAWSELEKR